MNTLHLLARFLTSLEARGRTPKTVQTYRQRLLRVLDYLPDNLEDITTHRVDLAVVELRHSGLAMASLSGYIQATKTFFKWAVEREYITSNPARWLEKPHRSTLAKYKAANKVDVKRMIYHCDINGLVMMKTIIMFMVDTGCRVGELINLDLDQLDLPGCQALTTGKTGIRELYFTDATATAMAEWLKIRPGTSPAVWNVHTGRITYHTIYNGLERIGKAVGAVRYNPHSIRHVVAQSWIDQGANLEVVRLKLGHRDITTTAQIYGNQDRERIKRATQRYTMITQ